MRTAYHKQLADLTAQLGDMCGLAGVAMKRATQALLEADIDAAEEVVRDHERIVAMRAQVEKEALALLALQQPVAGELRQSSAPYRSSPTRNEWARWLSM